MTPPINRSWAPDYLIRWMFNQDEFWVTAKGDKVLISKMGDGHAVNTLLMLERVAGDIEPLLTPGSVPAHIQDTVLYQALYRKVMAAVGEAFPPLAEPEIEPWDVEFEPELVPREADSAFEYPWLSEYPAILRLAGTAAAAQLDIIIDYTDRQGKHTTSRRVSPKSVVTLRTIARPFPEARMLAEDDDALKTFYVSRIDRARRA